MKLDIKICCIKGYAFGLAHPSLYILASRDFNYRGLFDSTNSSENVTKSSKAVKISSLTKLIHDFSFLLDSVTFSGSTGSLFYSSRSAFVSNPFLPAQKSLDLVKAMIEADNLENASARSESIQKIVKYIQFFLPKDQNTMHFLEAAHDLGVPWRIISAYKFIVQYGEGARLKLMSSSLSESESPLGSLIASTKPIASQYLKSLGYPIQPHLCVNTIKQALDFASQHFPVVVKPVNAERGEGVEVDIRSQDELKTIVDSSLKKYKTIVIEKYIASVDYRLYVFQGRLIWAHRRVPPSLIGNGVNSISELLEDENSKRLSCSSKLKPIPKGRDFYQCLEDQGLKCKDILAIGDVCKVGALGLVARGGHTESCYEEVHPDNAQLAIDCCRQLGICLGGVDLLIPNISVSWRESVAHICEINAKPQLGTLTQSHLYRLVLESLVDNACIPSILIIVGSNASTLESISKSLASLSSTFGFCFLSSDHAGDTICDPFLDRRVRSCVALTHFETLFADGAPLPGFDEVFVDREISSSLSACELSCLSRFCKDGSELVEFEGVEELLKLIAPGLSILSQCMD